MNKKFVRKYEVRKSKDIFVKSLSWISVVVWFLMIIAMLILDHAKPRITTMFDRIFEVDVDPNWDKTLTIYIFYIMVIGAIMSISGITINIARNKRKGDSYRLSLILLAIITIFSSIYIYGKI